MERKRPFMSYAFAALSSICFIGGIMILSREGELDYVQTRGDYIHAR